MRRGEFRVRPIDRCQSTSWVDQGLSQPRAQTRCGRSSGVRASEEVRSGWLGLWEAWRAWESHAVGGMALGELQVAAAMCAASARPFSRPHGGDCGMAGWWQIGCGEGTEGQEEVGDGRIAGEHRDPLGDCLRSEVSVDEERCGTGRPRLEKIS